MEIQVISSRAKVSLGRINRDYFTRQVVGGKYRWVFMKEMRFRGIGPLWIDGYASQENWIICVSGGLSRMHGESFYRINRNFPVWHGSQLPHGDLRVGKHYREMKKALIKIVSRRKMCAR